MTTAIYFSATDTTKRITEIVASFAPEGFTSLNLTLKDCVRSFSANDVVIVGVPVYAGRVPSIAAGRLAALSGNGATCIAVVVYGNRNYDDALLELCDILSSRGFNIVSAGAFVAEHCIFPAVANGRPDNEDMEDIREFATLSFATKSTLDLSAVNGNRPYKEASKVPLHPTVDKEACNSCGTCAAECPARAIDPTHPEVTDNEKCITCCRCIRVCPNGARQLSGTLYEMAAQKFMQNNSVRRRPEWFV